MPTYSWDGFVHMEPFTPAWEPRPLPKPPQQPCPSRKMGTPRAGCLAGGTMLLLASPASSWPDHGHPCAVGHPWGTLCPPAAPCTLGHVYTTGPADVRALCQRSQCPLPPPGEAILKVLDLNTICRLPPS